MTTKIKPTDKQIKEAFRLTVDAIIGDFYQLWEEHEPHNLDNFELTRDTVSEHLLIHGGTHGMAVHYWCMNLTPEDFTSELNHIGVPTSWHE